jgi:peptide/nickel transport system substrate-binding protein
MSKVSIMSYKKGISKVASAVIISVIVTAIVVGLGTYYGVQQSITPATGTVTKTVTQTVTLTPTTSAPATTTTYTTSPTTTPTTTSAGYTSKIVTIGTTDKVTDLDPSNAYDFFTWEVLSNIMDGLVKYKPGTDQIVPAIASSWDVKNGSQVWIFHLRHDVKFADGTPLKAQDVVRSIKRVMTIKGDPSWLVTSFVKDVKALDDYTVEFDLKNPCGYFLALVATPPYFPVDPHYPMDKIVSDATWGGAGPYRIAKFMRDQYIVLEANPYYYGTPPKTQKIVIKFYKDAATLRLALEKHSIDIAWRTLRPTDYQDLQKNPNLKVINIPGTFIRYMIINVNMSPTNNVLVRRAIAAAINRSKINEVVFLGTMKPLFSLIPMGMWSHIDVFKTKYGDGNIQLAQKLLKEAGYSQNNKLKLTLWYTPTHYGPTEASLAAMLKQELEATGMIEVTIKSSEWATYVDQARKGQMMLSLFGWYPDYIDPDDYTTPFLHTGANKWTGSGYSNPTVDKLLDQAQVLADQDQRAAIYKQVQEILGDDVPIIPLLQGKLLLVTWNDVAGVEIGPTMLMSYYTLYKTSG